MVAHRYPQLDPQQIAALGARLYERSGGVAIEAVSLLRSVDVDEPEPFHRLSALLESGSGSTLRETAYRLLGGTAGVSVSETIGVLWALLAMWPADAPRSILLEGKCGGATSVASRRTSTPSGTTRA
jgi:hypothetical protein